MIVCFAARHTINAHNQKTASCHPCAAVLISVNIALARRPPLVCMDFSKGVLSPKSARFCSFSGIFGDTILFSGCILTDVARSVEAGSGSAEACLSAGRSVAFPPNGTPNQLPQIIGPGALPQTPGFVALRPTGKVRAAMWMPQTVFCSVTWLLSLLERVRSNGRACRLAVKR